MGKRTQSVAKIREFTSLAEHDAATAREGDVTTHVFDDTYNIRRVIHRGEAVFSVVDVVGALTDSKDAGGYWRNTKRRLLKKDGAAQAVTNCYGLKLPTAQGVQETDCANIKTMLRIIQSIPSPKAEPIKEWLAQVGFERIQETAEPDRAVRRMVQAYRDQGYSDDWIEQRIRQSMIDTGWTEEVIARGITKQGETGIRGTAHKAALGLSQKQHRNLKHVKSNSELPDSMNKIELAIDTLWKAASSEFVKSRNAQGQDEVRDAAMTGAKIAGNARAEIEEETGHSIITSDRTMDKPVDRKRLK